MTRSAVASTSCSCVVSWMRRRSEFAVIPPICPSPARARRRRPGPRERAAGC
jgi:hypothetical protein